jgi:biotin carboxyl carrier protein
MLAENKSNGIFLILIGIMTFAASCHHPAVNSGGNGEPVIITPVTTVQIAHKQVTSSVDLPAVTMFMNKSIVRATTTGVIEKISVRPGDFVSAGRVLFTIRTREAVALSNSEKPDTALSFKGSIGISAQKEGMINTVSYQKGDFVQEGDELAVISEQNSLVFVLEIPYELNRYIGINRKCAIRLPDSTRIGGEITGKFPEMDIQSQTLKYIVIPAAAGRLPANLFATITLIKSRNERAQVIPRKALLGNETQTEFWVMKLINDSTAVKVVVRKGYEDNEEAEITEPEFKPSDRLILTGNYGLPDTARISILKE